MPDETVEELLSRLPVNQRRFVENHLEDLRREQKIDLEQSGLRDPLVADELIRRSQVRELRKIAEHKNLTIRDVTMASTERLLEKAAERHAFQQGLHSKERIFRLDLESLLEPESKWDPVAAFRREGREHKNRLLNADAAREALRRGPTDPVPTTWSRVARETLISNWLEGKRHLGERTARMRELAPRLREAIKQRGAKESAEKELQSILKRAGGKLGGLGAIGTALGLAMSLPEAAEAAEEFGATDDLTKGHAAARLSDLLFGEEYLAPRMEEALKEQHRQRQKRGHFTELMEPAY